MPVEYIVDEAQNLVLSTFSGTVTDEEVCEQVVRLNQDPRVRSGYVGLIDSTKVGRVRVTTAGIRKAVEIERKEWEARQIRLAIVASRDLIYSLCRAYQILSDPFQTKIGIFRTLDEAARWLGVTLPEACPLPTTRHNRGPSPSVSG